MVLYPSKSKLLFGAMFAYLFLSVSCTAQVQSTKISKAFNMNCEYSAVDRSYALLQFILEDIKSTYPNTGGGGISEIKQTKTNVFVVSIEQEERIDQLSYELAIAKQCRVSLIKKDESTISFSH
jgi:hypothetical protein